MPISEAKLRGKLDLAAAQLGKKDIESVSELIEVFAHPLLVGTKLAPDLTDFLKLYAQAELAGGEQRESFVKEVYGKMSDKTVEEPLTGSDLSLADLVYLTRHAISNISWSFGRKKNSNFNGLPLAA